MPPTVLEPARKPSQRRQTSNKAEYHGHQTRPGEVEETAGVDQNRLRFQQAVALLRDNGRR